jgi:hypothetical protein
MINSEIGLAEALNGKTVSIGITLASLWAAYANKAGKVAESGRFPCPVTVRGRAAATHIYQGFGAIRLERINGNPAPGKGFQGEEIAAARATRANTVRLWIAD